MIRYEISVTAHCEVCQHSWTPCQWMGLNPVTVIEPEECPQCLEQRREAGRIIRRFDPIESLLE